MPLNLSKHVQGAKIGNFKLNLGADIKVSHKNQYIFYQVVEYTTEVVKLIPTNYW